MMHRFEWVSRNCVHKVALNCLNPQGEAEWVSGKIQSYRVYTILLTHEINLCIICFIEWAPKSNKKGKNLCQPHLPDAWKNHASGNYRMHGYDKIMHPVITGCMVIDQSDCRDPSSSSMIINDWNHQNLPRLKIIDFSHREVSK